MESNAGAAMDGGVALYTYNTNRSMDTTLNTSMVRVVSPRPFTCSVLFWSLCPNFMSFPTSSSPPNSQEADRSVADLLSTDVRSNVDFSLDVVFTTLPIELEQACRSAVITTLSKVCDAQLSSTQSSLPHTHLIASTGIVCVWVRLEAQRFSVWSIAVFFSQPQLACLLPLFNRAACILDVGMCSS